MVVMVMLITLLIIEVVMVGSGDDDTNISDENIGNHDHGDDG